MRQTQNAQKKDNRKSIFVIGLLLLLVAVIGFGGYTLSKYVTEKKETGTASVAKWGFTVETKTADLFGANYEFKTGATNSTVTATNDATKLTVKASSENSKVVAPGTTGSMTFTIGGTAEVKATIAVNMTVTSDIVLKYKTTAKPETTPVEYYPVKWALKKTVGENTTTVAGNLTLEGLKTELDNLNATVEAGAEYAHAGSYTIEWVWAFDGTAANANADKLDTLLGWTANGTNIPDGYGFTVETGTNTSIGFTLNISVTQVKGN